MTSLRSLDLLVLFLWWIIDNLILFGRQGTAPRRADRLSLLGIVLTSWVGVGLGVFLAYAGVGTLGVFTVAGQIVGLILLAAGIVIRSVAIAQLGRFHTPVVAIQAGHRVVDTGLYRHVRHPSYLGSCVAYFGFGLGLGSWVSAMVTPGMILMGYLYRIRVEERALVESLGDEYAAYQERTYRLIPGLY
jgi:protein-S-isoprenylcysteine O-methyltransferase